MENVPYEGGPKPLLGGASFVRFSSPLFSHAPWRPLILSVFNVSQSVARRSPQQRVLLIWNRNRSPTLGSAEGGHPDLFLLFRFPRFVPICSDLFWKTPIPEGPNLEKTQDLGTRLKFSSEIEINDIFKRKLEISSEPPTKPLFCGHFSRSRLNISSESLKFSSVQARLICFSRFGPSGICSDLLRFLPICFQNKSEQIGETPFCRPLLQVFEGRNGPMDQFNAGPSVLGAWQAPWATNRTCED